MKFIFLCEKLVKLTEEVSIVINLLNHKYWDRMHDGVSGSVEKYFSPVVEDVWVKGWKIINTGDIE